MTQIRSDVNAGPLTSESGGEIREAILLVFCDNLSKTAIGHVPQLEHGETGEIPTGIGNVLNITGKHNRVKRTFGFDNAQRFATASDIQGRKQTFPSQLK